MGRWADAASPAVLVFAATLAFAPPASRAADEALRNWFDDPFFQVRDGAPGCPVPLGPLSDEETFRQQTHPRSERGTRCWLAGECRLPNAYLYDPAIAAAVRARFAASRLLREASLWVTVQRRIVWVEGCVAPGVREQAVEKLLKGVPDVELLVINLRRRPGERPPYRTLDAARAAIAQAPKPPR